MYSFFSRTTLKFNTDQFFSSKYVSVKEFEIFFNERVEKQKAKSMFYVLNIFTKNYLFSGKIKEIHGFPFLEMFSKN